MKKQYTYTDEEIKQLFPRQVRDGGDAYHIREGITKHTLENMLEASKFPQARDGCDVYNTAEDLYEKQTN